MSHTYLQVVGREEGQGGKGKGWLRPGESEGKQVMTVTTAEEYQGQMGRKGTLIVPPPPTPQCSIWLTPANLPLPSCVD